MLKTIKQQNLIYKIFYESFLVYYTLLHFKEVRCLLIKLILLIGKQYLPSKFNLIFSLITLSIARDCNDYS